MLIAIVQKSICEVLTVYEHTHITYDIFRSPYNDKEQCIHIIIPENVDRDTVGCVFLDEEFILINDPVKIQNKLDNAWVQLREKRNRLLLECDYTQLADVPLSSEKKIEWQNYRTLLRDIPENTTDPAQYIWPPKPNNSSV